MTEEEKTNLKAWIVNLTLRIDNDLTEARNDFHRNENAWFAFRLALVSERRDFLNYLSAQIYALLNL